MKLQVQNPTYGLIVYEEGSVSGKQTLYFDGTPLTKVAKRTYVYENGDEKITVELKGSILFGVSLRIGGETIAISPKRSWYEFALPIALAVLLLIWGNTVALCSIIPVIGGLIGGACIGVFLFLELFVCSKLKKAHHKLLAIFGLFLANFLVNFLLALVFIAALT